MFKLQITASHESMRISNFLAAYCAADKEMQAKVVLCRSGSDKREEIQRV